jgi:hypothetical protein
MDKYLSSVLNEWNGIGNDASHVKPDLIDTAPWSPKVDYCVFIAHTRIRILLEIH